MQNALVIGCGNMGYTMLDRWAGRSGTSITVVERDPGLARRAADRGITVMASLSGLPEGPAPDIVFVATKPSAVPDVLSDLRHLIGERTVLVSVAAGVSLRTMEARLPDGTGIIRCMPNTPASIGEGMLVCCANHACLPDRRLAAGRFLEQVGQVVFIDEEGQMDAVTALSGSGPGYLFYFIECLGKAGIEAGLPPELAHRLALQTVYGASCLAVRSGSSPDTLRRQVTSPNGTTAAGLEVLMASDAGLERLLKDAVGSAKARSRALDVEVPNA